MKFLNRILYKTTNLKNIKKIETKLIESVRKTQDMKEFIDAYDIMEEKLNEKNKFIKKVIDTAPGIIYVFDIQKQKNIWTNKEIYIELGFTREEILKLKDNVLKHIMLPEDYNDYINNTVIKYNLLKNNDKLKREYRFLNKKTNKYEWYSITETIFNRDKNNNVNEILGFLINIDELKIKEEELRLNSEILKNANDSIVITDEEGTIISANRMACKNTGYSLNELIGKNPRILKSGTHNGIFYEDMWKTISSGKTWNGVIINKAKNGKLFTEQTTITPVANGTIKYYIAIKVLLL